MSKNVTSCGAAAAVVVITDYVEIAALSCSRGSSCRCFCWDHLNSPERREEKLCVRSRVFRYYDLVLDSCGLRYNTCICLGLSPFPLARRLLFLEKKNKKSSTTKLLWTCSFDFFSFSLIPFSHFSICCWSSSYKKKNYKKKSHNYSPCLDLLSLATLCLLAASAPLPPHLSRLVRLCPLLLFMRTPLATLLTLLLRLLM